jgi:antitoxin ParD1/3/4
LEAAAGSSKPHSTYWSNWQLLPIMLELPESRSKTNMPTRNVNLTGRYEQFVLDQVTSGRFKNASEVVRAGLGLLEQQNQEEKHKLALLRSLAAEGFSDLDQGRGIEIDDERELRDFIGRIGRRVAKGNAHQTRGD